MEHMGTITLVSFQDPNGYVGSKFQGVPRLQIGENKTAAVTTLGCHDSHKVILQETNSK